MKSFQDVAPFTKSSVRLLGFWEVSTKSLKMETCWHNKDSEDSERGLLNSMFFFEGGGEYGHDVSHDEAMV